MEQWSAFTSPWHDCFVFGKQFLKATDDNCFDEASVENSLPTRQ